MSAVGDVVYSFAEEQDFQQVLNICSSDDFDGLDYMAVTFHRWLKEPGRLIFLARMNNKVVALESTLLVDGGQIVVFQGRRVAPDLRGSGIAGALQRHVTDYIRRHNPEVSAVRLSRGDQPSPQTLAKYRLIAKEVLNICSEDDYSGLDYMAAAFHRWLKEPGRLVFLARLNNRVVALESTLLVDGGQTVVFQGRRVVPDLRGSGIAGAIQKHVTDYIRRHYPEVCASRLSRGDRPSPQTLAKYRLIAKEAILSLCCEATDLGPFINEMKSKLSSQADSSQAPVILNQQQAETLVLSNHVVSNLLPGKTIINDWEPLKPVEANLEVLRRRGLTWIVDHEFEPSAISLCTPPYPVPYRHDALRININIFGCSLASICAVFLAQLEALLPKLHGYLIFYTYVDPGVWPGLRQFCQNNAKVSFFKDYWEELVLETDL